MQRLRAARPLQLLRAACAVGRPRPSAPLCAAAAAAAARPPPPPPPDVRALAAAARLEVSDEQVAAWTPQLAGIVQLFATLRDAVELDGVLPLLPGEDEDEGGGAGGRPGALGLGATREDVVTPFPHAAEMLAACGSLEGGYVRVGKLSADEPAG